MNDDTSPRPWVVGSDDEGRYVDSPSGCRRVLLWRRGAFKQGDADLIVRAVNAHDALVAACKAALDSCGDPDEHDCLSSCGFCETAAMARAALALAEGE